MWISIEERLPAIGAKVSVRGKFTPDDYEYPEATYDGMTINGLSGFRSKEWRGTVAITHWWESDVEFVSKQSSDDRSEQVLG